MLSQIKTLRQEEEEILRVMLRGPQSDLGDSKEVSFIGNEEDSLPPLSFRTATGSTDEDTQRLVLAHVDKVQQYTEFIVSRETLRIRKAVKESPERLFAGFSDEMRELMQQKQLHNVSRSMDPCSKDLKTTEIYMLVL